MTSLPSGKLPVDLLRGLLARLAPTDPRVIVGPRGLQLRQAVDDFRHFRLSH